MNKLNEHIDRFLDYYCDLESPEYAVMLKGKWGSGKTYYINNFIKRLKEESREYVYISLYGVSSFEEVEDKFFEQLHPALSDKKMILGGKIFKDFLHGALNIEVDEEKNEFKFPKYLTDTQEHILIFDDLERCSIPINEILGYLNNFVEHQYYRVIVLANEDEIKKDEQEYPVIKEKLIGKIFELKSNVDMAFESFIKKADNKELFDEYSALIKEIYLASGYDNLRFLRQSILDFSRFYKSVLAEYGYRSDLVRDMLRLYFIFSFENKKNDFDLFKLDEYHSEYLKLLHSKKERYKSNKCKYKLLVNKYRFDFYYLKVFSVSTWNDILNRSIIEDEVIQKAIRSSEYYNKEFTPEWKKLWHYISLEDEEFESLMEGVEDELKEKRYDNLLVVMHVCSMFLNIASNSLYKGSKEDILNYSKANVDHLFENKKIDKSFLENPSLIINQTGYSGLGFLSKEDKVFKELLRHIELKLRQAEKESFTSYAKEIVELIGKDDDKVYIKLLNTRTKQSRYYDKPILSFMSVDAFTQKIADAKYDSLQSFGYILEERYRLSAYNEFLVSEMVFLERVKDKLEERAQALEGRLSGYNLKSFIDGSLSIAIQNLQKYIKRNPDKV